ncbi:MAG: zinc ribbon domain-containing protein [Myxococcales bacterium]
MPTYEYACSSCQHHWEEIQRITADPIDLCPQCTQRTARRQISGGTFILKGGGWYADLYSSPKAKKSESSGESTKPAESSSAEGAKSETKTDAKPAPTAPSTPAT